MFYKELIKNREINPYGGCTPYLVTSFSSTIVQHRQHLNELIEFTAQYITDISLVSAYDLYYGYINEESIYGSEILIIDSGCYESKTHLEPVLKVN